MGKFEKQPKNGEEETKNFSELFKGIDQKSIRGKTRKEVRLTVKNNSQNFKPKGYITYSNVPDPDV